MSAERNAERGAGQGAARVESPPPVQVVDAQGGRPFMRGIMVHSLMSRGASFEDAYRSATAIRDKLRGRGRVPREELARMAAELLGPEIEMRPLPRPRSAEVCEAGKAAPFSKGVLAQSLLAAAIAPPPNLKMLLKCVSGPAENLTISKFWPYVHTEYIFFITFLGHSSNFRYLILS